MQILSMKVFCDLVEAQSFTKAAQINEVTQSAVSQTISALEKRFKSLLIERRKKKFTLTTAGELLYKHGKEITSIAGGLEGKLKATREATSGIIQLDTIFSIGLYDLPSYIKKFLKGSPNASVRVQYRSQKNIYQDVLSNKTDIGLVDYPVRTAGVQAVFLRNDPLVLICHPQDPLVKRNHIKLKTLHGKKFIGFALHMPIRKGVDRIFWQHHLNVNYDMEFDSIEAVKRAVQIFSGLAIVPEVTVRQEVANQTLAMVRLDEKDFVRPLAAIHKKVKVLSPAMKKFITLLKEPA